MIIVALLAAGAVGPWTHDPRLKLGLFLLGVAGVLVLGLLVREWMLVRMLRGRTDLAVIIDAARISFPQVRLTKTWVETWPVEDTEVRQGDRTLDFVRPGAVAQLPLHWLPEAQRAEALSRLAARRIPASNALVVDAIACFTRPSAEVHVLVLTRDGAQKVVAVADSKDDLSPHFAPAEKLEVWSFHSASGGLVGAVFNSPSP